MTHYVCQNCQNQFLASPAACLVAGKKNPRGDDYHPSTFCSKSCEDGYLFHFKRYPAVSAEIPSGVEGTCNLGAMKLLVEEDGPVNRVV